MKPRTACCCLLGVLCCWNQGYSETIHRYTDKNGVICFSNSLSDEPFPNRGRSENLIPASSELQRAREQAEIEHWRAVEARARSLRNIPDTEVHRKGRPSLQGEDFSWPKARAGKRNRRWETEKMRSAVSNDQELVLDPAESKKSRSWPKKFQSRKYSGKSESQGKKRRQTRKKNVALR
jgi:hypothetical protein